MSSMGGGGGGGWIFSGIAQCNSKVTLFNTKSYQILLYFRSYFLRVFTGKINNDGLLMVFCWFVKGSGFLTKPHMVFVKVIEFCWFLTNHHKTIIFPRYEFHQFFQSLNHGIWPIKMRHSHSLC